MGLTAFVFSTHGDLLSLLLKHIKRRRSQTVQRHLTTEEIGKIVEMYDQEIPVTEIAKTFAVNESTVRRRLNKIKGPLGKERTVTKRKYTVDESFFEVIDTPEKAYVMGWFYSDGSNDLSRYTASISLAEDNSDALYKIRDVIGSDAEIKISQPPSRQRQFRLRICNKVVSTQIARLGTSGNVTYTRTWPTWLSEELNPYFIRGLVEGDGFVSARDSRSYYTGYSGTIMMCEALGKIVERLNIRYHIYPGPKVHGAFRITRHADTVRFLDYIYADATIYLDRKYANYLQIKEFARAKEEKNNRLVVVE